MATGRISTEKFPGKTAARWRERPSQRMQYTTNVRMEIMNAKEEKHGRRRVHAGISGCRYGPGDGGQLNELKADAFDGG